MSRHDGRQPHEIRPVHIHTGYTEMPAGSVLIHMGKTRVLCTASVEEGVPGWLKQAQPVQGWVTAEYAMLPGATQPRQARESTRGKVGGRTHEIQRLIGRSLRAVMDLERLGPRTIQIDCDVLQADGGTRTAAITGGFVALALALGKLVDQGLLSELPLRDSVTAISCGIVNGEALLDLPYVEDAAADVDMNVVMTGQGRFIEVQGSGEEATFSHDELTRLLALAGEGVAALRKAQLEALPKTATFDLLRARG